MNKKLQELLIRAERWPDAAQEEFAQIGLEIEEAAQGGAYVATGAELAAIDDAERGGVATVAEVEAALAKFRHA